MKVSWASLLMLLLQIPLGSTLNVTSTVTVTESAPIRAGIKSRLEITVIGLPPYLNINSTQILCGKEGAVPPLPAISMSRIENSTIITAAFPEYCSVAGPVGIKITSFDGGAVASTSISVLGSPRVVTIFPSFGSLAGGTVVVIDVTQMAPTMSLTSVSFFGVISFSEIARSDVFSGRSLSIRTVTPRLANLVSAASSISFSGQSQLNETSFYFPLREGPYIVSVNRAWTVGISPDIIRMEIANVDLATLGAVQFGTWGAGTILSKFPTTSGGFLSVRPPAITIPYSVDVTVAISISSAILYFPFTFLAPPVLFPSGSSFSPTGAVRADFFGVPVGEEGSLAISVGKYFAQIISLIRLPSTQVRCTFRIPSRVGYAKQPLLVRSVNSGEIYLSTFLDVSPPLSLVSCLSIIAGALQCSVYTGPKQISGGGAVSISICAPSAVCSSPTRVLFSLSSPYTQIWISAAAFSTNYIPGVTVKISSTNGRGETVAHLAENFPKIISISPPAARVGSVVEIVVDFPPPQISVLDTNLKLSTPYGTATIFPTEIKSRGKTRSSIFITVPDFSFSTIGGRVDGILNFTSVQRNVSFSFDSVSMEVICTGGCVGPIISPLSPLPPLVTTLCVNWTRLPPSGLLQNAGANLGRWNIYLSAPDPMKCFSFDLPQFNETGLLEESPTTSAKMEIRWGSNIAFWNFKFISAPALISAVFSDSFCAVKLTFTIANDSTAVCSLLLPAEYLSALGMPTECVWVSKWVLMITLGTQATIQTGDTICVSPSILSVTVSPTLTLPPSLSCSPLLAPALPPLPHDIKIIGSRGSGLCGMLTFSTLQYFSCRSPAVQWIAPTDLGLSAYLGTVAPGPTSQITLRTSSFSHPGHPYSLLATASPIFAEFFPSENSSGPLPAPDLTVVSASRPVVDFLFSIPLGNVSGDVAAASVRWKSEPISVRRLSVGTPTYYISGETHVCGDDPIFFSARISWDAGDCVASNIYSNPAAEFYWVARDLTNNQIKFASLASFLRIPSVSLRANMSLNISLDIFGEEAGDVWIRDSVIVSTCIPGPKAIILNGNLTVAVGPTPLEIFSKNLNPCSYADCPPEIYRWTCLLDPFSECTFDLFSGGISTDTLSLDVSKTAGVSEFFVRVTIQMGDFVDSDTVKISLVSSGSSSGVSRPPSISISEGVYQGVGEIQINSNSLASVTTDTPALFSFSNFAKNISSSLTPSQYYAIPTAFFLPYTRYTLVVSATNSVAFQTLTIIPNFPPKFGTCKISPTTGEELASIFTISCSGWVDEDFPLRFDAAISNLNLNLENSLIPFATSPLPSLPLFLPAGTSQRVYVRVCDKFECCSEYVSVEGRADVTATAQSINDDFISTQMKWTLGLGCPSCALQFLLAASLSLALPKNSSVTTPSTPPTSAILAALSSVLTNGFAAADPTIFSPMIFAVLNLISLSSPKPGELVVAVGRTASAGSIGVEGVENSMKILGSVVSSCQSGSIVCPISSFAFALPALATAAASPPISNSNFSVENQFLSLQVSAATPTNLRKYVSSRRDVEKRETQSGSGGGAIIIADFPPAISTVISASDSTSIFLIFSAISAIAGRTRTVTFDISLNSTTNRTRDANFTTIFSRAADGKLCLFWRGSDNTMTNLSLALSGGWTAGMGECVSILEISSDFTRVKCRCDRDGITALGYPLSTSTGDPPAVSDDTQTSSSVLAIIIATCVCGSALAFFIVMFVYRLRFLQKRQQTRQRILQQAWIRREIVEMAPTSGEIEGAAQTGQEGTELSNIPATYSLAMQGLTSRRSFIVPTNPRWADERNRAKPQIELNAIVPTQLSLRNSLPPSLSDLPPTPTLHSEDSGAGVGFQRVGFPEFDPEDRPYAQNEVSPFEPPER